MSRWKKMSIAAALAATIGATSSLSAGESMRMPMAAAASANQAWTTLQTELKTHLNRREEMFTLKYQGSTASLTSRVMNAIDAILNADDSLGYTVDTYAANTSFTRNEATIRVQVRYWENAAQTAYVIAQTKEIAKQIAKPGMNAHEKVKAIHDWVLLHVAYDRSLVQHSAYAALTMGKTVCQGYALLTYRLLNEAGVPNRIVEGTVATGLHAWNLVQLDGKWYHLDTTFDDPVPDKQGRTTYGYYLITDKQIKKDHRWTKTYPAAITPYANTLHTVASSDKDRAAFYKGLEQALGYSFLYPANTVADEKELAAKIASAKKKGQTSVRVRWTGGSGGPNLRLLLDGVPHLSEVNYTSERFPLGNAGDVILQVNFQ